MPISTDRMLSLLAATEDLHGALGRMHELVQMANKRVREEGADPLAELEVLEAQLAPEMILRAPLDTLVALDREKAHWTPGRVARNARKRDEKRQERARGE